MSFTEEEILKMRVIMGDSWTERFILSSQVLENPRVKELVNPATVENWEDSQAALKATLKLFRVGS